MNPKFIYRFTKDNKYIKKYYSIRKRILGISQNDFDDEINNRSEILIIKNKDEVLGGARLTISDPSSKKLLPMENIGFRISDLLPELKLTKELYAEYSNVVMLPSYYRSHKISHQIYKHLNRKSNQLGVRYVFVIADSLRSNIYLRSCKKLGYPSSVLRFIEIKRTTTSNRPKRSKYIIMLDLKLKHDPLINNEEEEPANNIYEIGSKK